MELNTLTNEQKQEIERLYLEEGLDVRQIRNITKIKHSSVLNYINSKHKDWIFKRRKKSSKSHRLTKEEAELFHKESGHHFYIKFAEKIFRYRIDTKDKKWRDDNYDKLLDFNYFE